MTTNNSSNATRSSLVSQVDNYEPLEVIGSGTFGIIRKVRKISDGKFYARKELNFERMSERDRKQIVAEVNILRNLQHENVVKYEERWVDGDNGILYIVMEYCGGGDLGSIIKKCRKNNTLLSEDTIWTYLYQMVLALDVCHYRTNLPSNSSPTATSSNTTSSSSYLEAQPPLNAILHRDLKPENVFLDSDSNIKLGDFGLSKQLNSEIFTNTYVGTPYYMSPELATGKSYDSKSDIWALGCIGYELGALSPPFDASNQAELTRKIRAGNVPQLPRGFSLELGNLIRQMLDLNPNRRPTTRQLLTHPQIIFAKRTLELTSLKRTLQNETIRLRDYSNSLSSREQKLVEYEQELKAREELLLQQSSSRINSNANQETQAHFIELKEKEEELVGRERQLKEQEERLEKGNEDLDDRRADLERKWLNWRDGERLKKDEEMRKCLLERDAARNALEEHLKRFGNSSHEEGHLEQLPPHRQGQILMEKKARRISLDPASAPPTQHAVGSKRPILTKRVSSGSKVNIPRSSNSNVSISASNIPNSSSAMSIDQTDLSMLNLRERVMNGTTGFGTPKAIRERELRTKERQQRGLLGSDGVEGDAAEVESDEWIDHENGSNEEVEERKDTDPTLKRSRDERNARRSAGRISVPSNSSSIQERSSRNNLRESSTVRVNASGRSSNASAPRSSAKYDLSNSSRNRRSSGIVSISYSSNGNGLPDSNPTIRSSSSDDRMSQNFTYRDLPDSRDESDVSDVVMKTFIEDDSLSPIKADGSASEDVFNDERVQEEGQGETSNETTSSDIRANDTFDQVLQDKENRRSRAQKGAIDSEKISLPRNLKEDLLSSRLSNLEFNKKELSPSKSTSRGNSLARRADRESTSYISNASKRISPSEKITAGLIRPALASRTTLPAVINQSTLTEVPNYDLEDDLDLPSPFLRKVSRLENEKLKPSSRGGLAAQAALNKARINGNAPASVSSVGGASRVSKVGTAQSAPTSRMSSTTSSRNPSSNPIINRRQSTGNGLSGVTTALGSNASAIANGKIPASSSSSRPRASAVASSTTYRETISARRR